MSKRKKICIAICFGIMFGTIISVFAATSDPWDGTTWNVAAPDIDQPIGNHYKEMYDLRKGVAIRINKEHVNLATSSVGGEHIPGGSAILFYDDTTAVDANVSASTFIHDDLIYDTTLLQFFTMNEAGDTKVAIEIGIAGIADANITTVKIADANVTTAKIVDGDITLAKIDFSVDEDDMVSDSAILHPTQQSVKAYVDGIFSGTYAGAESFTFSGFIIKHGEKTSTIDGVETFTFAAPFTTACVSVTLTIHSEDTTSYMPVNSISAANFTIDRPNVQDGDVDFYWQAFGH